MRVFHPGRLLIAATAGPAALALAALALAGLPAAAQDVGVTAAVNPASFGTVPGEATRTLELGGNITFLEEIETDDGGQAQVLFLDQSTLTVGPNSFIVIDEFVFDPSTSVGNLVMNLERGLVRYVGGEISKEGGVTIDTAVATVGIRGGMAILDNRDPTRLRVVNLFGQTTVNPKAPGSRAVVMDDTSELAVVERSGLEELGSVTSEDLGGLYQNFRGGNSTRIVTATVQRQLASNPSADVSSQPVVIPPPSPANSPPSPQTILADTQNQLGSEVALGLQQEQISNTQPENTTGLSGSYNATPNAYVTPTGGDFSQPLAQDAKGGPDPNFARRFNNATIIAGDQLRVDTDGDGTIDLILPIQEGDFEVALSDTTTPLGAVSGSGSYELLDGDSAFFSYSLTTADGRRELQVVGGLPTDPSVFQQGDLEVFAYDLDLELTRSFPNMKASQLLVATAPGGGFDPLGGTYRTSVLWMTFAVESDGEVQSSMLQATAGKLTDLGNGKPVLVQTARGSSLIGGQPGDITRSEAALSSLVDADGNAFFGDAADRVVLSNNGPFPLEGSSSEEEARNIGQVLVQPYDNLAGVVLGYSTVTPRVETPEGAGAVRPSTTLTGYASGVGVSRLPGNQFSEIYILESSAGEGSQTGLTVQRSAATSSLSAAADFQATAFVSAGNAPTSARWVFGDIGSDNAAYLDEQHYAALESFEDRGQGFDGQVNRNDQGADGENRYGFRSLFVGQAPLSPQSFFPETQFCECAYLQWGFWSGEYEWDPSSAEAGRRERVHIGTWVAGQKPSAADIAGLSGEASHSGHVFGTVVLANGTQRLASGQYDQTFNFGTDTGSFKISNFDGRTYDGGSLGLAGTGHQADFKSTKSATAANGYKADIKASFFKGGGDAAKQVGGTFKVTDGGAGRYGATGIVAADRKK